MKTSYFKRFFKIWLLAITCLTRQLSGEWEGSYADHYSQFSEKSPPNVTPPDCNDPCDAQWKPPVWFSHPELPQTPSTESDQDDDSEPLNSPYQGYQNQPWPAISNFETESNHGLCTSSSESEYDNFPTSSWQESPYDNEQGDFADFDPSDTQTNDSHTSNPPSSTQEGGASTYSSGKDTPTATDKINLDSSNAKHPPQKDHSDSEEQNFENNTSSDHSPAASVPNLSQGKSNIKVVKKNSESLPITRIGAVNADSQQLVEKEPITSPAVGYLTHPPDHLSSELAELKDPSLTKTDTLRVAKGDAHLSHDTQIFPRPPTIITPNSPPPPATEKKINDLQNLVAQANDAHQPHQHTVKEISVVFNNVSIIEFIRFVSRVSNKNFIFDDDDLQFNVTILSEEPISIENLMAALLQELRIRNLSLIEQGNNIIIHRNPRVRSPARIVGDGNQLISSRESELVTRVFRLNTLDPTKASEIIRPLLSDEALVEVLRDTNNLVVTDLVTTVNKVAQLIDTLDAPNSGVTIGQYVVRNGFVDSLVDLSTRLMQPIAQGNPFVLVPQQSSNSIFIVSNPFIVEKALAILENLDLTSARTKIIPLDSLHPSFAPRLPGRAGGAAGGAGGVAPGGVTPGGLGVGGAGPGGIQGVPGGVPGGGYPLGAGGIGVGGATGGIGGAAGIPGGGAPGGIGVGGAAGGAGGFPGGGAPGGIGVGGAAGGAGGFPGGGAPGGIGVGGVGPGGVPGYPGGGALGYPLGAGGIGTQGQLPVGAPESYPFGPGGITPAQRYPYPGAPGAPGYPGFLPGGIGAEGGLIAPGAPGYYPGTVQGGIGSEGSSRIFDESRDFLPGGISSISRYSQELPAGHIERTLFYLYKLRYRRGDQIEIALRKIANSLQLTGTANADLVSAINSSQWIESSNALIFTGSGPALEKIKELVEEIDTPLRQVFIEMLIIQTQIMDSLTYGVEWDSLFFGGPTSGFQNFAGLAPVLAQAAIEQTNAAITDASALVGDLVLNAANAANVPAAFPNFPFGVEGYTANVVGTHITHNGTRFNSIGALVKAIHGVGKANILLNPKIITEDNNTAEIFVGTTDRYKVQSLANDLGSIITNNFQFIDVGTLLRVTPLIGNNGIITLDIVQESSNSDLGSANAASNANAESVNLVTVLSKSRVVTKIHVPNGFFVILSGMIQETETRNITRVPCLGGIPIIGGFCNSKVNVDNKTNLMIFIRPLIVDSEAELEDITRRQQDVFREKSKLRRMWNYEIDEALDSFQIKNTDPDEIGCNQK